MKGCSKVAYFPLASAAVRLQELPPYDAEVVSHYTWIVMSSFFFNILLYEMITV